MFTFDATPVKFVGLLILFIWCTVWCGYELTRRQSITQRVSGALHLMMAIVMLLMVSKSVTNARWGRRPSGHRRWPTSL